MFRLLYLKIFKLTTRGKRGEGKEVVLEMSPA